MQLRTRPRPVMASSIAEDGLAAEGEENDDLAPEEYAPADDNTRKAMTARVHYHRSLQITVVVKMQFKKVLLFLKVLVTKSCIFILKLLINSFVSSSIAS